MTYNKISNKIYVIITSEMVINERWNVSQLVDKIIKNLSIDDLETIINEKRYEEKARKMIEADSKD